MKRLLLFSILLLAVAGSLFAQEPAAGPVWEIESLSPEGVFEYDLRDNIMTATNRIVVKYRGDKTVEVVLTADKVSLNQLTGLAQAEGAVVLRRDDQFWTGNLLEYNFISKEIRAETFRTGLAPFYAAGAGMSLDLTNRIYTATNAVVTTDDVAEPIFKIRAKQLTMSPGKYIEARDAVLYLGNVPVMYYPYYRRSLERHPNNFAFTPGYRSLHGPFLLSKFNWHKSENLSGTIHLDYRQKRGVGAGPDLNYNAGRLGHGFIDYYYLRDEEPGSAPTGEPIRDDRHRLSFNHHIALRTNLMARVVVREQSDAYIIRDFFESEYRKNVQPSSFLEVNQVWPNFSLSAIAQPQLNTFFETVERLPDVKLSAIRQQLGVSPFYYEGESSAGYFRYKYANDTKPDYAAFRADTFHQIVLPQTLFGWLNVTPRIGGRLTQYGEAEGDGTTTTEENRAVFNTGAEVSTKISRLWRNAHSKHLEIDGLRHIIEPSVNYVFVPSPSKLPRQLPQFDRELPSFRLLPIEYPDYNAIDSIDSQNVLRFGLRNKLQTKRNDQIDDLLDWAVYTDWRIKPRPDQSTFADLYSDLDLKPRSWLILTSQTRFDIADELLREANHLATFKPNDVWSLSLGHRYLRDDLALGPDYGNNLITTRAYYKLNENWAFRVAHQFEARDGTLEEQYYTVYRDLRSWTAALTFRVRENRVGQDDYTIAVTLSLKAFPRFGLGEDSVSPAMLVGS